jgi:DNA helicase-2/ATP-dependent DNA helicase PcrA
MFDSSELLQLREQQLQELKKTLRSGQQGLAEWKAGQMAVSAVPGSGKSHSLSVAAAMAIATHQLHSRKQLVIVTYTRSAAANIKAKIRDRLKQLNLPQTGFIVQTLHGLALNIASRHSELSQLNLDSATIIIPTPSHRIIRSSVEQWIVTNNNYYQNLLKGKTFDQEETEILRRQSVLRTEVLPSLAHTVIREAKSSGLLPEELEILSQKSQDHYQILAMAAGLYQQYQNLMKTNDFIDYDDLILAALRVLENPEIRQLWQTQVFAVFEDEAQDSSPLQERLINLLALDPENNHLSPNLIRVGDPNQAINSTFTPADPIYFNWFCETCNQQNKLTTMDQAGRSNIKIIQAANFVLQWVNQSWKPSFKTKNLDQLDRSELPFRDQKIKPVNPNDPQPDANPEGEGLEIYFPEDIYETVNLIGQRILKLLTENPHHNAAILVRENRQGSFLYRQLLPLFHQHKLIKLYEVGEIDRKSHIPGEILKILQFLDRPHSPDYLKAALEILEKRQLIPVQDLNALVISPEQFLYPTPLDTPQKPSVQDARKYCCNLLRARLELPHYQLITFLGMTLKYSGSELATVQKLSERINQQIVGHSSLKSTIEALIEIVNSERFEAVEEDNEAQYTRQGQLTIITMHKSKGLDWDYVFIPFLHEDTLPGQPWIPTGAKFLGDFTLAEVARAQLRVMLHHQYKTGKIGVIPDPLEAWKEAGKLKKAEEFRLLYVAITRAKRLLWMSAEKNGPFRWSVFQGNKNQNLQPKQATAALLALKNWLVSLTNSQEN